MAHDSRVVINSVSYDIAHETLLKGKRGWQRHLRPSQPSDPGLQQTAVWPLSGPIGLSREGADGRLGVDYADNLDTRYSNLLTSTAKRTAISLLNPSQAAQYAVPTSDISKTNWSQGAGDGDGNAFDELDEGIESGTVDDATSYWTTTTNVAELRVGMDDLTEPEAVTQQRIRVRARTDTAPQAVAIKLFDGATQLVDGLAKSATLSTSNTWTTLTVTLTADESRDITDYTDLRVGVVKNTNDGGTLDVSAIEWEIPAILGAAPVTLLPNSTVATTNWTETNPGGTDGEAYNELNNGVDTPTTTTYWETTTNGSGLQVGVEEGVDPGRDDGAKIRGFIGSPDTQVGWIVRLYEGSTIIWQSVALQSDNITDLNGREREVDIPAESFANVSDFTDLRVAIIKADVDSDRLRVYELELQLPPAGAGDVTAIDEDRGQLFLARGEMHTQVNPASMEEVETRAHGFLITDTVANWLGVGHTAFGSLANVNKRTTVDAAKATYDSISGVTASKMTAGADRLWLIDALGADSGQAKFAVAPLDDSGDLSNGINVIGEGGEATGIYTLGPYMLVGTQRGPRSFTDAGAPQKLGEAVKDFPANENGAAGDSLWGWHYHATKLGLFAIDPVNLIENPVGPGEGLRGQDFEGPIDGYPTAVRAYKDSLWVAYLTTAGDTYIIRGTFGPETGATGRPEWYPFQKVSSTECHAIGGTSGRAVPAVIWGEDDQAAYADLAFRGREISDTTNYVFSTSGGQWFGSTLMRSSSMHNNIRYFVLNAENCDADNTWQVAVSVDEGAYVNVGSAITSDGHKYVRPSSGGVPLTTVNGHTFKPRLTQVAASETSPPQLRGTLTMVYDSRPDVIEEHTFAIHIEGARAETKRNALLALLDPHAASSPVSVVLPGETSEDTARYAFVTGVQVSDATGQGDEIVTVTCQLWEP